MSNFFHQKYYSKPIRGRENEFSANLNEKYQRENFHKKGDKTVTIIDSSEQSTPLDYRRVVRKVVKLEYKAEFTPTAIGGGNNKILSLDETMWNHSRSVHGYVYLVFKCCYCLSRIDI